MGDVNGAPAAGGAPGVVTDGDGEAGAEGSVTPDGVASSLSSTLADQNKIQMIVLRHSSDASMSNAAHTGQKAMTQNIGQS